MKRALAALLVLVMVIFSTVPAYCETPAFRKFRRGFCNILTCHLEFMHQVEKAGAAGGNNRAFTVGLFNGICMSAGRLLAGVYEVATFPLPFPPGYKPIMTDPEFYWTEPFAEGEKKTEAK